ncbi:MAG: DNA repair exonuclease [Acidimicrobiales bacterium]|jgi:DNA repair exonuclease SbcCD nuclease subunit
MAPSDGREGDFCFVHAADLHLDTPFKGIGETAPVVAEALREASLEAFDNLVALCLERRAAFLLIAGDVYDGPDRGIRAQLRFRDGLGRLSEAGISAFVVHGNHDPVESGWAAVASWPPLVTIFGTDGVGAVPVRRDGHELAVVQGISYWRRDVRENLALRFSPTEGRGLQIGLLHCNVSGAPEGHEEYSPCSLDDLRGAGLDYWALGHVHSRLVMSGRPHGDEPWVVYPGNLQGRSPKASELGAKGAFVVEVAGGRVAGVEFVACDRIRYASVDVDLTPLSSVEAVRDALAEAAQDELASAEGRSIVVRARLSGRSEVHAALQGERAVPELLVSLRDEFRPLGPWCWWDRIEDDSAGLLDLGRLRAGSDFAADLICVAEELAASCAGPSLSLGLEAELPAALLDDITATLPKALRIRAMAASPSARELLSAGLMTALDELGADESLVGAGH